MNEHDIPRSAAAPPPSDDATGETPFTRRQFIRYAAFLTAGGLTFAPGVMECLAKIAKDLPETLVPLNALPKPAMGHVARVLMDESACAGCGMCSLVCAAVHGQYIGLSFAGIWLNRKPFECLYDSITCQQCDAPECFYACHAKGGGAIFIDDRTGARAIDPAKCMGCLECMEACVFSPSRITFDPDRNIAFKCDLCAKRPEGPACVAFCPHQALALTKET